MRMQHPYELPASVEQPDSEGASLLPRYLSSLLAFLAVAAAMRYLPIFLSLNATKLTISSWLVAFVPTIALLACATTLCWIENSRFSRPRLLRLLLLTPPLAVSCLITYAVFDHFEVYFPGHPHFVQGNLTWLVLISIVVVTITYLATSVVSIRNG